MRWFRNLFDRTVVKVGKDERAIVFLTTRSGMHFDYDVANDFKTYIDSEIDRLGLRDRLTVFLLDGVEPQRIIKLSEWSDSD